MPCIRMWRGCTAWGTVSTTIGVRYYDRGVLYCTLDDHVSRADEFGDAVDGDALVYAVVGRFETVEGEDGFSSVAATDCCFRGGDLNE